MHRRSQEPGARICSSNATALRCTIGRAQRERRPTRAISKASDRRRVPSRSLHLAAPSWRQMMQLAPAEIPRDGLVPVGPSMRVHKGGLWTAFPPLASIWGRRARLRSRTLALRQWPQSFIRQRGSACRPHRDNRRPICHASAHCAHARRPERCVTPVSRKGMARARRSWSVKRFCQLSTSSIRSTGVPALCAVACRGR